MPNNFAPKRRHKTENKNKQKKKRKKDSSSACGSAPPKLLQNKEPQNITMLYINFSGIEVIKKKKQM